MFNASLRQILLALLTAHVLLLVSSTSNLVGAQFVRDKQLTFYHTHTGKTLDIVYFRNGAYDEDALAEVNAFLADFRTGDVATIDRNLLDILHDIRQALGSNGTYEVISAYRSPKTNEMLRASSSGVASNSQHLLGKAIDVRLRGIPTEALRDAALAMKRGGVGYYESSDFVHIDNGRIRSW